MSDASCSASDVLDDEFNLPLCFTNKAIKIAQSVYFASSTFFALCSVILILRTELFSFFHISVVNRNSWVLIACAVSLTLTLLIVYLAPLQTILGTGTIDARNLLSPAAPFIIIAFGLEELRKRIIRSRTPMGHWLMQRTMW
jgi:magnesium-transporting ATPase (P-type)